VRICRVAGARGSTPPVEDLWAMINGCLTLIGVNKDSDSGFVEGPWDFTMQGHLAVRQFSVLVHHVRGSDANALGEPFL
jgi:hypothetical protein